ncbi:hypothetical protein ABW20_dc0105789 [Dactylellina cionopaga]|nr:hypothetical protein ABW20_dc0105789 [Dactylellina cionopaga]
MHFLRVLLPIALLLVEAVNGVELAGVEKRTNKAPQKSLTITKVVQILKCKHAQKWCSDYLGYSVKTTTTTTTKIKIVTTRPLKSKTTTITKCLDTTTIVYDTAYEYVGSVSTITEYQETYTDV